MLSSIWGLVSRRARVSAAALAVASLAFTATNAKADDERPGSAYSFSFGTDFTSHFISYGADVWGGGNEISMFSPNSTIFEYGTMNVKFADNLSGFVNIWSDNNDNVNSGIGGPIQEIDVNTGLTYTWEDLSVSVTHGFWCYAGDEEKVLDFGVSYADKGKWTNGFALNPNFVLHWRYDGNGGQDAGMAAVAGLRPSITVMEDSKYPLTIAFPASIAYFENGFQGGDAGIGFISAGAVVSVPLKFIPAKYGAWTASASLTYFHTPNDQVPNNPRENFIVSALSVGMSF